MGKQSNENNGITKIVICCIINAKNIDCLGAIRIDCLRYEYLINKYLMGLSMLNECQRLKNEY